MKWLAFALVILSGCAAAQVSGTIAITNGSSFTAIPGKQEVQKLTPEEANSIKVAREKVEAAQKELDSIENQVKGRHGQSSNMGLCYGTVTAVELWGDYALIDTYPSTSCISAAAVFN